MLDALKTHPAWLYCYLLTTGLIDGLKTEGMTCHIFVLYRNCIQISLSLSHTHTSTLRCPNRRQSKCSAIFRAFAQTPFHLTICSLAMQFHVCSQFCSCANARGRYSATTPSKQEVHNQEIFGQSSASAQSAPGVKRGQFSLMSAMFSH
jgi:hypothetical protein